MKTQDMIWIIVGLLIGLAIAYFFLWGVTYSGLNSKYNSLKEEYAQLGADYNQLQEEYNQLKQECSTALTEYKKCIGRENFFKWISRFASLAKLISLVV